jgi:phage terminase large subunit
MKIKVNRIYKPVFGATQRYFHLWGGRGRGGTHFATDYALHMLTQPGYFRGGFFRATFGQIKTGLWTALQLRITAAAQAGDLNIKDFAFNNVELKCTYKPTGNSIICKGFRASTLAEQANMKGIDGLTFVVIDEAEDIDEEEFNKLDDTLRTTAVENIQIFFLFNPPGKNHWLIKRFYILTPSDYPGWYVAKPKENPQLLSIHSTYLDNINNIHKSSVEKYRNYGNPDSPYYNPDRYYRDVLGLVSEGSKGRIYTNVKPISRKDYDELPYSKFYGLDFGFSNDPCAVVEVMRHNNTLWVRQTVYSVGLTNEELSAMLPKNRTIYADSAEPKSIATLRRLGHLVTAAVKGADSVRAGIKALQELEIYCVESSSDLWREFEDYKWQLDGDKEPTDQPEDRNNHALDALRYAVMNENKFSKGITAGGSITAGRERLNSWNEGSYNQLDFSEIEFDD